MLPRRYLVGSLVQNLDRLSPKQRLYTFQSLPAHLAAAGLGGELVRAQAALLPMAPDPAAGLRGTQQAITDHLVENLSNAKREEVLGLFAEKKLFALPRSTSIP